jgi:hypothetical protein
MSSARSASIPDESSARYYGWRVVAACFVLAVLSWGFGFYGHGFYLAELKRLHDWPASLIAGASTASYLFSALLVSASPPACCSARPRLRAPRRPWRS